MDDRCAPGYVLTLEFAVGGLTARLVDRVVHDLDHLSPVLGPWRDGYLALHCTVSAPSEADAVRYAASQALAALTWRGAASPRLLDVEPWVFDDAGHPVG